jgi:hypothetical protein
VTSPQPLVARWIVASRRAVSARSCDFQAETIVIGSPAALPVRLTNTPTVTVMQLRYALKRHRYTRRPLFTLSRRHHDGVCGGHRHQLSRTDPAYPSHGFPSITLICTLAVSATFHFSAICQHICHHASVIARISPH